MSLILGVNLPQYLYLVSDTRLTIKSEQGVEYRDNFCKFYCFNETLSVVAAGSATLANFVLRQIGESDLISNGLICFEEKINQFIKKVLDGYMAGNHKYASTVLIFAGFDKSAKKQVNASQYGKVLSGAFIKDGQPTQPINMNIMRKIAEAAIRNRGDGREGVIGSLDKNSMVEVDYPYSSIITVEINLPHEPIINKIDCYKFVMKAPKGLTEDILPEELAYRLECRQSGQNNFEEIIQSQSVALMAWVNKIIQDYNLETVGGDILTNMVTPEGAVIMTGALSALNLKTKGVSIISEVFVENGEFCVRDKISKEVMPLQNIYNFNGDGDYEI